MLICPGCKAILKSPAADGTCPQCGYAIRSPGLSTEGPHEPTLDVTAEFQTPASAGATDRGSPQATLEFAGGAERSVHIAPRKLSRQSVEMITGNWRPAISEGTTERTSLKIEGQSASGMGSSLIVNLRGLRGVEEGVRPRSTTGADYELLQVIGKGGMGVVYSARQASVDRLVAVKMIRPQVAANPERREKFLSEAVVTGDLDHPNIVPIYELGADENNALFYSMKRVQGTPWSHVIGTKSLSENLEILMKVADAVAFAHANGVVHRDLKPENVMLGDFGEVLVMDWGLALATSNFRHAEFVTTPDSMGGTPAYMAPEMVTGPFELIGPPCDIYLLGALLFEIVTGLRPHHGRTAQECLLAAARNEIQPTDKTGELMDIAYKAMATHPADRFASVQEFQTAIREYHSHMESIALSTRADAELSQARQSGNYQSFAKAVFGFEEALALWAGNTRARSGVAEARLAYAIRAKQQGDFELGISLLDASNPQHATLRAELEAAQRERDARQKWLSRFKRIAAGMAVATVSVILVALYLVNSARHREADQRRAAERQTEIAEQERARADHERDEATRQAEIAQKERDRAEEARQLAEQQTAIAKAERQKAIEAEQEAENARDIAEAKEAEAVLARRGEERAAYGARIGMAAAKLEENAFETAVSLLAASRPVELRDWEWGFLHRLTGAGRGMPANGTIRAVAIDDAQGRLITAGDDGHVHVWDRRTNKPLGSLPVTGSVHAVAVSPDGATIAAAGDDGKIHLIRAADLAPLGQLAGHTAGVLSLDFSADGALLASSASDNSARLWNMADKRPHGEPLRGHYGWVWSAALSPDGRRLVTAGEDGRVLVWSIDPASGADAPPLAFLGHQGPVFAADFSPDGQQIVSVGYDKRVLVWRPDALADVDLKQLVAIGQPLAPQAARAFEGHAGPVRTARFTADGKFVLSAGDDNTIRIWDITTGKPHAQLRGHSRPVLTCAIAADGNQLLSGGQEGEIKLWDLVDYKPAPQGLALTGHGDAVLAAGFSPDGTRVITAGGDHTARVFECESGQCLATLHEGHDFLASRAIYFDGGRRLLTAGGDRTARLWDATSGTQLQVLEHTGRNGAIAVSRDGRLLLTGNSQTGDRDPALHDLAGVPQLALWQLDDQRQQAARMTLADPAFGTSHLGLVTVLEISPDGKLLFSGDDTGAGILWDAATGAIAHRLKGHTTAMTDAEFTPDGKRLLTASRDGTVAQWDVASGQELPGTFVHGDLERRDAFDTPVAALAIAPNGRELATLAEEIVDNRRESVLRQWDLSSARLIAELYRGVDALTSVAYTGDGTALLVAGTVQSGGVVRRFDLAARREVRVGGGPYLDLTGRREGVWSAIEAPGGGILAVGGNGAALWNAGDDDPELMFKPHSGVTATAFSPSGKYAVTASSDRRAKIWNAATGLAETQLPPAHGGGLTAAQFSPVDEQALLTAGEDGTARIWHWPSRKVVHTFEHLPAGSPLAPLVAIYSPDGAQVLTAGSDGRVRQWNATTAQELTTWSCEAPVLAAAYSHDGARILVGLASGVAIVFDARTHAPLVRYAGHTDAVQAVAFSPLGKRVLTGSRDRLIKLWDADPQESGQPQEGGPATGKELLTLRHHEQAVSAVGFSPDGRTVLSASLDGEAVLWPTDDWRTP
jgi:WD40 repeat protein/serine/threonine protein kinase